MPNTTDGLPYPATTDDVDVAGDIQALAVAVDSTYPTIAQAAAAYRTITDSYTKADVYQKSETYTQAQINAAITARVIPVITGGSKLHYGSAFVQDLAAGGKATITHSAGFTPDQVIATVADLDATIASHKGMVCNVLTDTIDANSFAIRVYNTAGNSIEQGVRVTYVCRQN